MYIGVVYSSKSGNTEKLTAMGAEILKDMHHTVSVIPIEKYDYTNEIMYDLLIIGSYCDSNSFPKSIKKLFESINQNKKVACFVTHAAYENGPYYDDWAAGCEKYYNSFLAKGHIESMGYFHCRSKPSLIIEIFMKLYVIKNKKDWIEYKSDMNKYPGENEYNRFKEFIRKIGYNLKREYCLNVEIVDYN